MKFHEISVTEISPHNFDISITRRRRPRGARSSASSTTQCSLRGRGSSFTYGMVARGPRVIAKTTRFYKTQVGALRSRSRDSYATPKTLCISCVCVCVCVCFQLRLCEGVCAGGCILFISVLWYSTGFIPGGKPPGPPGPMMCCVRR